MLYYKYCILVFYNKKLNALYVYSCCLIYFKNVPCDKKLNPLYVCFYIVSFIGGSSVRHSQAYRKGYRYPRNLFFMIPWYVNGWWRFENDSYGCTVEDREETLEYSMTVMNLPFAIYLNMSTTTETGHAGSDNDQGIVRNSSGTFTVEHSYQQ